MAERGGNKEEGSGRTLFDFVIQGPPHRLSPSVGSSWSLGHCAMLVWDHQMSDVNLSTQHINAAYREGLWKTFTKLLMNSYGYTDS